MRKSKQKSLFTFICVAPSVILFTIFMLIPTINIFWMSLLKWGGLSANKKFVGLSNFIKLFSDLNFIRSLQNTLFLIVIVTLVTISFALFFEAI